MATVYGLTLWQPHATLMAIRAKQIETRSRATHLWEQRPWVAIHAAAATSTPASWIATAMSDPIIRAALADHGITEGNMPMGAILAIGRLVNCEPTVTIAPKLGPMELAMGDYRPGRFALQFEDVTALLDPIHWSGKQGFWTLPGRLVADIEADLMSDRRRSPIRKRLT